MPGCQNNKTLVSKQQFLTSRQENLQIFPPPYGGRDVCVPDKASDEIAFVGEADPLGDFVQRHFGRPAEQVLGFFDAQRVNPLAEGMFPAGIGVPGKVGAVGGKLRGKQVDGDSFAGKAFSGYPFFDSLFEQGKSVAVYEFGVGVVRRRRSFIFRRTVVHGVFNDLKLMGVIDKPYGEVEVKQIEHDCKEQSCKGGHEQGGKQRRYADGKRGKERKGNPAQAPGFHVGKIVVHPQVKPAATFDEQESITRQEQGVYRNKKVKNVPESSAGKEDAGRNDGCNKQQYVCRFTENIPPSGEAGFQQRKQDKGKDKRLRGGNDQRNGLHKGNVAGVRRRGLQQVFHNSDGSKEQVRACQHVTRLAVITQQRTVGYDHEQKHQPASEQQSAGYENGHYIV